MSKYCINTVPKVGLYYKVQYYLGLKIRQIKTQPNFHKANSPNLAPAKIKCYTVTHRQNPIKNCETGVAYIPL